MLDREPRAPVVGTAAGDQPTPGYAAAVLNAIDVGIAVISLDPATRGRIEFANGALSAMLGATPQELRGGACLDLVVTSERVRAESYFEQIAAGQRRSLVCHLAASDGATLVVDVRGRAATLDGAPRMVIEFRRWRDRADGELGGPGELRLDLAACEVHVGDAAVPLSRTQFDVLAVLLERRGEVVSHASLARVAWGAQELGSSRNFIEAAISRLRAALRLAGAGEVVETVSGHGYMVR